MPKSLDPKRGGGWVERGWTPLPCAVRLEGGLDGSDNALRERVIDDAVDGRDARTPRTAVRVSYDRFAAARQLWKLHAGRSGG